MNNIISIRNFLLLILISSISALSLYAQDEEAKPKKKQKSYLYLDYFKKTDGTKQLVATLKSKVNKKFVLMANEDIVFMHDMEDSTTVLATIKTDHAGQAIYTLNPNNELTTNANGELNLTAAFEGNKTLKPKNNDVTVKDINLEVSLELVDSVKKIIIETTELVGDSIKPVHDVDINIYVERMFSLLQVGEGSTDNGALEFIFPDDIPGDSVGNLIIYTLIEDDRNYANVENIQMASWGIPVTERESFKRSFSGGSYILFIIFSVFVGGAIFALSLRKK